MNHHTILGLQKIMLLGGIILLVLAIVNIIEYGVLVDFPIRLGLGIIGLFGGAIGITMFRWANAWLDIAFILFLVIRVALYIPLLVFSFHWDWVGAQIETTIFFCISMIVVAYYGFVSYRMLMMTWPTLTHTGSTTTTMSTTYSNNTVPSTTTISGLPPQTSPYAPKVAAYGEPQAPMV